MQLLKRVGLLFAVGGFVGDVVAMLVGPKALVWFQTPALGQALCDCVKIAEETGAALVRAQLIATGTGGVIFVVFGVLATFLWKRRALKQGLDLVRSDPS